MFLFILAFPPPTTALPTIPTTDHNDGTSCYRIHCSLICSLIAFLAALGTDVEMSAEATFKGGKPNIKGNFKTSSGDNKTVVKEALNDVRKTIVEQFSEWFAETEELAKTVAVETSIPRRCGRKTQRENCPPDTPEIYYRRVIGIPYLDDALSGMEARFFAHYINSNSSTEVGTGICTKRNI
ncbi:unnamed protein product [Mytilus edulis]|uniref:Uncharacterized protein n=1 Tax=Mytilus edulis TaxID=6550 RepID=A0A8S3TRQ8_MYTED|nr:unnamed protein product [Mytilus edulis]